MLKGFIVIFTGVISYYVFKKKFTKGQVGGVLIVVVGLVLVGLSNINSYSSKFAPRPLLGNSLVILAQFFLALMFVYEEKILKEYDVNVFEIVGWEGVWGMFISFFFIVLFYFIPGRDFGSWENPIQATLQLGNNNSLLSAILISSTVIGPFNYFGTNLTKYSSAMHRCLIDASRMLVVWLISILCKWEQFKIQQAIGYTFVLFGSLIYYEIIKLPFTENNIEHTPLPKNDDTLALPNKDENIMNDDKEKFPPHNTLGEIIIENELKKDITIYKKIFNFFFPQKVKKQENKETNNIVEENNSCMIIDEKQVLKEK